MCWLFKFQELFIQIFRQLVLLKRKCYKGVEVCSKYKRKKKVQKMKKSISEDKEIVEKLVEYMDKCPEIYHIMVDSGIAGGLQHVALGDIDNLSDDLDAIKAFEGLKFLSKVDVAETPKSTKMPKFDFDVSNDYKFGSDKSDDGIQVKVVNRGSNKVVHDFIMYSIMDLLYGDERKYIQTWEMRDKVQKTYPNLVKRFDSKSMSTMLHNCINLMMDYDVIARAKRGWYYRLKDDWSIDIAQQFVDLICDTEGYSCITYMDIDKSENESESTEDFVSMSGYNELPPDLIQTAMIYQDENGQPRSVYRWALVSALKAIEKCGRPVTSADVSKYYKKTDAYKLEKKANPKMHENTRRIQCLWALRYGFYMGWFSRVNSRKYYKGENFDEIYSLDIVHLPMETIKKVDVEKDIRGRYVAVTKME